MNIPHPNIKVSEKSIKTLKNGIEKLVACMYAGSHFAVMELDIVSGDVLIFDGLSYPLKSWIPHLKNLLTRCSLLDGQPEDITVNVLEPDMKVIVQSGT